MSNYPYIATISISNWSGSDNVSGSCNIQQALGMSTSLTLDGDKCRRIFSLVFDMIEEDVKKAGAAMQALKRPPALESFKADIEAKAVEAEPVPDNEAKPFPATDEIPF